MSAEQTYVTYAYDADSGIARITLDDAAAGNPVHTASLAQLLAAARRVNADGARVVVLAARGRFFSVGGDLAQFGGSDDMAAYIDDLADGLHRALSELVRSDAIVVTAVQGAAAGAGFPLAAAGDIVVAARSASFTFAYTRAGLSPDGGSSLLVHTLGLHRALRLVLLNDKLGAEEALAAGLVARVVDDADLEATTEEIATRLATGAAGAQATAKRLLRQTAEAAPESRLRAEALGIRVQAGGPEGREGVAAFLEKRTPRFGPTA